MLTLMSNGGPLMWLILFSGLVAAATFFERLLHYHRAQINTGDFVTGIRNALGRGNIPESLALCDETPGPVAQVVRVGVLNHNRSREEIREAMQDAGHSEVAKLERNLPILATVAQVAPLMGFLGTVLGMIAAFRVIEQVELATPGQLSKGVWEALQATAGGLIVAIPTYVAYNYLVTRLQNLVLDMEQSANAILNLLTHGDKETPPITLTKEPGK
jgi:biopolymer transport protein ExbB